MYMSSDIELFNDEALADPFDLYRELRNQAPVVWMSRYVFSKLRSASILAVSSVCFSAS
jgi:hypothetical protein